MGDVNIPFFDRYPVFYDTSGKPSKNARIWLNARYDVLIARNIDLIQGKRLLDLGSNDGRWSFSSLMNGASHVTGVEWNGGLVDKAKERMKNFGIDNTRYNLLTDNLNNFIDMPDAPQIDTALVLGMLYLQSNHLGLFRRLSEFGARSMIIDTSVCRLFEEGPEQPMLLELWKNWYIDEDVSNGLPRHRQVAARATVSALRFMLDTLDYDLEEIDWKPYLDKWDDESNSLSMYRDGERKTFIARKRNV